MAKRFTDTEKFDDAWYRKLTPAQKCVWEYALAKCNYAGVWKFDLDAVSFHIGAKVSERDLDSFKGRFVFLSSDTVFIPKFLKFQYGELKEDSRVHQGVIKELETLGIDYRNPIDTLSIEYLKSIDSLSTKMAEISNKDTLSIGYPKGIDTLKEKEKEQDNIINNNILNSGIRAREEKITLGEFGKVKLTPAECAKVRELYGDKFDAAVEKLDGYLAQSVKNERRYSNHRAVLKRGNWVWNEVMSGAGGQPQAPPRRYNPDDPDDPFNRDLAETLARIDKEETKDGARNAG